MLAVFLACGSLLWVFYDRLPWVGTHFSHRDPASLSHWAMELNLQESRAIGNSSSGLDQVSAPDRQARLAATLRQEGRRAGSEWAQVVRVESVESTQYSWEQADNRDLLVSQVDLRVGPRGGLRTLQVQPEARSIWMRQELLTAWLQTLWPAYPSRGLEVGDGWTSEVPFQVEARELSRPLRARWLCSWSFRALPADTSIPLALLELKAEAVGEEVPLEGNLAAEILYSVLEGKLVGSRGSFGLKFAAPTEPEKDSSLTLLSNVRGQFQLVRTSEGSNNPTP